MEFPLRCGVTLQLKAVSKFALREYIDRLGGWDFFVDPARLLALEGDERNGANEIIEQLWTYCAGWGVEDELTPEADEEMKALGLSTKSPRLTKASWIRNLLLEDAVEAWSLVYTIWATTFGVTDGGTTEVEK